MERDPLPPHICFVCQSRVYSAPRDVLAHRAVERTAAAAAAAAASCGACEVLPHAVRERGHRQHRGRRGRGRRGAAGEPEAGGRRASRILHTAARCGGGVIVEVDWYGRGGLRIPKK
eukprot:gene25232-biopygen16486